MVCQACGSQVGAEVRFCPRCGAQVVSPAGPQTGLPLGGGPGYPVQPPPPVLFVMPRVQRHLQTLGYLWCAYGVLRLVTGLVGLVFVRAMFNHYGFNHYGFNDETWPFRLPLAGAMMPMIVSLIAIRAVLALFTGYSLLTRRPWGRTLGIVVAILTLIKPLMGTALGIYTLWVLAPAASGVEYDAIAEPG